MSIWVGITAEWKYGVPGQIWDYDAVVRDGLVVYQAPESFGALVVWSERGGRR